MKIYIDFDDVICETAKYFTKIAKELFNIDVPYREVQFFNLQKSFDLSGEQYDENGKMIVDANGKPVMEKHRELQK